jgi:hypothetical protein
MSARFAARAFAGPPLTLFSLSGRCFRPIRNTAAAEPVRAESPAPHSNAADAGLSADCLRGAAGAAPSLPMMPPAPSWAASPNVAPRRSPFPIRSSAARAAPEDGAEPSHGPG